MNRNLILEIDYRENGIINDLKKMEQACNYNYTINNLPIGDFIIKEQTEQVKEQVKEQTEQVKEQTEQVKEQTEQTEQAEQKEPVTFIHYIFERKSLSDLSSSIVDGRFREQKQRLLESIDSSDRIVYIIETGSHDVGVHGVSRTIIDSAILNLIFKHKYKVIFTKDKADTLSHILLLYNKIRNNEFEIDINGSKNNFTMIKKKDALNKNIFINMLCTIPGVSLLIANKIKEHYTTLADLFQEYNKLSDINDKHKLVSTIKISDKRKLGLALSKKIYMSLYESEPELEPEPGKSKSVKNNGKSVKNNGKKQQEESICLL